MTTYAYPEPRVGYNYEGYIDAAVAAKKIRAEIKTAKEHGAIPHDVKVSVRTSKYAGGQSVEARLSGWNPEAVWVHDGTRFRHTPAAQRVADAVERIRGSYNRDASDPMTDYFEVTYYGITSWDVYPWSE